MRRRRTVWLSLLATLLSGGCSPSVEGFVEQQHATPTGAFSAAADEQRGDGHVGVLVPDMVVELAPPTVAEVVAILVSPGDAVAQDRVVATFDARSVREELKIARAELRRHQAAASEARVNLYEQRASMARVRRLAEHGHASVEEQERSEFAMDRAEASHESVVSAIAETRARIDRLERYLDDTSLRAPFAGIVLARHLEVGALAGPDAPIMRLVGTKTLCRFAVPLADAESFTPGTHVRVRAEPGGEGGAAIVLRRSLEVDPASHLVVVDAEVLADREVRWPIGTPVRVDRVLAPDGDHRISP